MDYFETLPVGTYSECPECKDGIPKIMGPFRRIDGETKSCGWRMKCSNSHEWVVVYKLLDIA